MGCCESNEVPDFRTASQQELWDCLRDLSSETQYRLFNGFDTGNAAEQGQRAYEALSELNRRYLYSWKALELELRKRGYHIWLYRTASLSWEDDGDGHPGIAVLLGSEKEAQGKRELHAKAGIDQSFE